MSQDRPTKPDLPEAGAEVRAEDLLSRRRLIKAGLYAAPVLLSLKGRSALGQSCESPYGFFSGNTSSHSAYTACTPGMAPSRYLNCGSWPAAAALAFPAFRGCTSGTPTPINCNEFSFSNPTSLLESQYHLSSGLLAALANGACSIGNSGTQIINQNNAWGSTFASIFGAASAIRTDLEKSPIWLILWNSNNAYGNAFGVDGLLAGELIAAYMNAKAISGYPLKPKDVIDMWTMRSFGWCPNAYANCPINPWHAPQILSYLRDHVNTVV
jgi:hypothetical protein